ncbi:MAG: metal-dependent transcriptional regulator [Firmicutes bacterium]|nr:metal-dependent transcriptional regulator [Bacillota bacterium]MBR3391601.1 metal-dependent transcriptional regulator [Bacillota bacterium]
MRLHKSGEDYLEAILVLHNKKGSVRSIDIADYMGVSKPSISNAIKLLREGGFLVMDENKMIKLTKRGREEADRIYERHRFLTEGLIAIGVSPEVAEEDACKIEHDISAETFDRMKEYFEKVKNRKS